MDKIIRFFNTFRQGLPKYTHQQDVICGGVIGTVSNMWFNLDVGEYIYVINCPSGRFITNESSLELVEE